MIMECLQEIRESQGYTLQEVANGLQWNEDFLKEVEAENINISTEQLSNLLNFYGYGLEVLA